ncbi:MAG: S49 family peptidase, partial [Pseudolabrys sp.]
MPDILKRALELLGRLVPVRFRAGIPVVPVVRLSGVIGVTTPLRPG